MVSVVVPTFNRAHMIARAIGSISDETFTDWEVIVVDDASSDDPRCALREYAEDDRLRFFHHERNRGPSASRNTGIAVARDRYLAFLDSDDLWQRNKLEVQIAAIEFQPDPDLALCVTKTQIVMPGGWSRIRSRDEPATSRSVAELFAQLSSLLLSRKLAERITFRKCLRRFEDHLFVVQAEVLVARYLLNPEVLTAWVNEDREDRICSRDDFKTCTAIFGRGRKLNSLPCANGFRGRVLRTFNVE
jgi:glycosyltransferase involved in cell wall biosynthesis